MFYILLGAICGLVINKTFHALKNPGYNHMPKMIALLICNVFVCIYLGYILYNLVLG